MRITRRDTISRPEARDQADIGNIRNKRRIKSNKMAAWRRLNREDVVTTAQVSI
jgi:hypothetical protein